MLHRIALTFVIVAASALSAFAAVRPNVLLICVDDLKPLLACYGDATVKTPNIDKLAARGVLFERAYCNQAVCSPSRNALLVGLRPQTLGIYDLATNFRKSAPDAVTLPQYFKQHGYHTQALGKIFHVGHGNIEDKASWSAPHFNAKLNSQYILDENQPPLAAKPKNPLERIGKAFENRVAEELPIKPAEQPRGAAYESADVGDDAYRDGIVGEETARRLKEATKKPDQPFFIAAGFARPHLPFCAPKKYWDLYDRASFKLAERQTPPDGAPAFAKTGWGELRNYAGMPKEGPLTDDQQRALIHGYYASVSYMDAQVGKVLAALDENGLAKNTIVVFWGDHGWHLGDHGQWCKHTNYEQAARIPVIVAGPGGAKGKTAALIESVDIYPTLCELAGLPAPSGLDGRSFAATYRDISAPTKDTIIHVYPRGEKRMGRALRDARFRLIEWKVPGAAPETATLELYDYEADPLETKNLAGDRPEVVARLRKVLASHPEAK